MDGIISIEEIKSQAKGHWFDRASMRFFSSRLPQTGIRKGDKAYFISSEQFKGLGMCPDGERMYSIRVLDYKTGDIGTVGEFNQMSKSEAQTALRHILQEAN
jgi:hypothetical protein